MKKILSDKENFDYLLQNIPAFLMSSGGFSRNVSEILVGRPSKFYKFSQTNKFEELEKQFKLLCENSLNKLNLITMSNGSHAFAIKDSIKVDEKTLFLIRNPWGYGNKKDIDSSESDAFIENIDKVKFREFYEEFHDFNSNYTKTGLALLNVKYIQKKFKRVDVLDFEAGSYIYKYSISEKNKAFDFILEYNKDDEIKIDITNFKTDLQKYNNGCNCINEISILNENNEEHIKFLS